jgi:NADH:ubiquinone oxidoreductase subunit 6 (subunit J)
MTLAWLEGINALAGLYAIVTPFVVATPTNAMYSNVLLGLILVVVAGWDAYVGMTSSGGRTMPRRGRAV